MKRHSPWLILLAIVGATLARAAADWPAVTRGSQPMRVRALPPPPASETQELGTDRVVESAGIGASLAGGPPEVAAARTLSRPADVDPGPPPAPWPRGKSLPLFLQRLPPVRAAVRRLPPVRPAVTRLPALDSRSMPPGSEENWSVRRAPFVNWSEPRVAGANWSEPRVAGANWSEPRERSPGANPLGPSLLGRGVVPVSVEELVTLTLANSPRVQVIRLQPAIEQQRVGEAAGRFDWTVYLRNRWLDSSRPAGSELDVGVPQARWLEQDLQADVGLRRLNTYGGQWEVSQVLQGKDSNSVYFTPKQQALTNLTLRYSQPLLRDRGTVVNLAQVVLAQHVGGAADATSQGELADHLLRVVEAYWDVHRLRSHVSIQMRLHEATLELLRQLRRRHQIDASRVMIVQAEATALAREATLAGRRAELRQAQNQLVRLTNAPAWDSSVELLPTETPFLAPPEVSLEQVLASAAQNRPEVAASLERIKGAEVNQVVQQNQLLPQLALVLENTLYGLRGDYDLANSWADQFSLGRPTWSAGLLFEQPLGNHAAKARLRRAELEAAREVAAMADVVQQVRLEVMNAVVELETAFEQLQIRRTAKEKAAQELESLERRRLLFPETDRVAFLYLQELLDSQQRLATAEGDYADSEVAYAVAILRLRRAEGILWQASQR